MLSVERIQKALKFVEPDYVPVCPLYMYPAAEVYGTTVREYATSGKIMAESLMAAQKLFGFDGITVGSDVTVEAEAVGSIAEQPLNSPAHMVKNFLEDIRNFDKLTIPDPYKAGRMPVLIEATKRCAEAIGDEIYIMVVMQGPINIASQLRGVENLMMDFYDRPDFVIELLEYSMQVGNVFAKALAENGARCMQVGEALASPSFMSPAFYKKYLVPFETRQHKQMLEDGVEAVSVHICGKVIPILDDAATTNATAIDLDAPVDMGEAKKILGTRMAIRGNIDPSSVLYRGTPDDVEQKVKLVIEKAGHGGGLILGSGCDVPYGTPKENLMALVNAARKYGKYPL